MNKWIIVFVVALGLAVGFSLLELGVQLAVAAISSDSLFAFQVVYPLISIFVTIGITVVTFAVFYLLSSRKEFYAEKATVIALAGGFLLGAAIPYLVSIIDVNSNLDASYFGIIFSALVSSVVLYFFPALAGMLYGKLHEKKPIYNQPIEETPPPTEQPMP